MKKLTIDDFNTNRKSGECIAVDFSQSTKIAAHSLENYHPKVLCDKPNKFLAWTFKEDLETIRIDVNSRWANDIQIILNSLFFKLDGNKIVAKPSSRPKPINGWFLSCWEIEIVKLEGCNDKNKEAFKDTLTWVRYDLTKIDELCKNSFCKQDSVKFLNSVTSITKEITTTWHWRNNK